MDAVSDHVHGHGLAICGNGAAVVDLHGGPGRHRFVKVRDLAPEIALGVVRILRAAAPGTAFAVERTGGLHHEPTYPPLHLEAGESVAAAEKLLADGSPCADQPVLKLLAYHADLAPDEFLVLARAAVGDRAAITRSSPSALLEISGPGVSKASTLALCCAERGITAAEVVAFGDMPNDMEMLRWAAPRSRWATRTRTFSPPRRATRCRTMRTAWPLSSNRSWRRVSPLRTAHRATPRSRRPEALEETVLHRWVRLPQPHLTLPTPACGSRRTRSARTAGPVRQGDHYGVGACLGSWPGLTATAC